MRHKKAFRKLGRTMEHRRAMQRNMLQSLVEHGQIRTTLPKAKDLRPFAERVISLAKKARDGDLGARRRIHRLMGERFFIPSEHQGEYDDLSDAHRLRTRRARTGRHYRTGEGKGEMTFTGMAISHRLIQEIAARFQDRAGGYTRIVKLPNRRVGDQGLQAILQLVGEEETPVNVPRSTRRTSRRRKADARYAALLRTGKKSSGSRIESESAARSQEIAAEANPENVSEPEPPAQEPQE